VRGGAFVEESLRALEEQCGHRGTAPDAGVGAPRQEIAGIVETA